MDLQRLKQLNAEKEARKEKKAVEHEAALAMLDLRRDVVESFRSLVDYLERRTSKTQVVNQLKEIGTPDALKVADAVNQLHDTMKGKDIDLTPLISVMESGLSGVEEAVKNIPKTEIPEDKDYTKQFNALANAVKAVEGAVKAQETNVEAPVVNVEAPNVTVDAPDLKPFVKELKKAFSDAVGGIKYPEIPKTDLTKLEKEAKDQTKLLKEIRDKPVGKGGGGGGRATPYEDSNGVPAFITLVDGKIPVSLTSGADPSSFYVYDIEEGTSSYYGNTNVSGAWMVKKVTDTLVSYATVTNNVAVTTYTDAWTDRATLTYGRIDEAF